MPPSHTRRQGRIYICRVLPLTLLAPDIVERIMDGGPAVGLARALQPFPVEWGKQRQQFLSQSSSVTIPQRGRQYPGTA
jgi:hypothetical protein